MNTRDAIMGTLSKDKWMSVYEIMRKIGYLQEDVVEGLKELKKDVISRDIEEEREDGNTCYIVYRLK